MKCAYVGSFKAPYSTENYIAYALEELGVQVTKYEESLLVDLRPIIESKPDFVLFCKARTARNGHLLIAELKKEGIKTVAWLFDLYLDIPPDGGATRSILDAPFDCDYVFSTDGGHDTEWKARGINHFLLRQGIHELEAKIVDPAPNVKEIIFTGSIIFSRRLRLLKHMRSRYGNEFMHYGQGGDMPEIRQAALSAVISGARIVLGDSQPSPNYWSNRIYEVLGRGGFLVHPMVEGIEKEFTPYEHFIPYNYGNYEELDDIVDYYLKHPVERNKIRLAGHEHCKKNYTYTKRVAEMLKIINGR